MNFKPSEIWNVKRLQKFEFGGRIPRKKITHQLIMRGRLTISSTSLFSHKLERHIREMSRARKKEAMPAIVEKTLATCSELEEILSLPPEHRNKHFGFYFGRRVMRLMEAVAVKAEMEPDEDAKKYAPRLKYYAEALGKLEELRQSVMREPEPAPSKTKVTNNFLVNALPPIEQEQPKTLLDTLEIEEVAPVTEGEDFVE